MRHIDETEVRDLPDYSVGEYQIPGGGVVELTIMRLNNKAYMLLQPEVGFVCMDDVECSVMDYWRILNDYEKPEGDHMLLYGYVKFLNVNCCQ